VGRAGHGARLEALEWENAALVKQMEVLYSAGHFLRSLLRSVRGAELACFAQEMLKQQGAGVGIGKGAPERVTIDLSKGPDDDELASLEDQLMSKVESIRQIRGRKFSKTNPVSGEPAYFQGPGGEIGSFRVQATSVDHADGSEAAPRRAVSFVSDPSMGSRFELQRLQVRGFCHSIAAESCCSDSLWRVLSDVLVMFAASARERAAQDGELPQGRGAEQLSPESGAGDGGVNGRSRAVAYR